MAAAVASAAPNSARCAARKDADSPEKEMKEPAGDDAELVAEAEAVAAGWMLDFLCLSLCRAFRDGRSEDFRRTRDSAEGECGRRAAGRLLRGPRPASRTPGRVRGREPSGTPPPASALSRCVEGQND